jgi:hypothetical protein
MTEENELEQQYQRVQSEQRERLKQVEQAIRVLKNYMYDEHAPSTDAIEAGIDELREIL